MMTKNHSFYVCQSPLTSYRDVFDHTMIVDHSSGAMIVIAEVASFIWRNLGSWTHIQQIVNKIQKEYDIDEITAYEDALSFIEQLHQFGLLIKIPSIINHKPSGISSDPKDIINSQLPPNLKNLCRINNVALLAFLELTERCNLHCAHCYNARPDRRELSTDEIKTLLDDLATLGCLDIVFTGGEPLVRKDFQEILWHSRERRFCSTLKTNATLIDTKIAKLLADALLAEVHVSLYSMKAEEHERITLEVGSHARTLNGIKLLVDNGIKVRISCPLTKINCFSSKEVKEFAESMGIECSFDTNITAKVDGNRKPVELRIDTNDLNKLLEQGILSEVIYPNIMNVNEISNSQSLMRNANDDNEPICGAGRDTVAINSYGDVLPCIGLPLVMGNVLTDTVLNIWNNTQWSELRSLTNFNYGECIDCNIKNYCFKCPAISFSETNNIVGIPKLFCDNAKYLSLAQGIKKQVVISTNSEKS